MIGGDAHGFREAQSGGHRVLAGTVKKTMTPSGSPYTQHHLDQLLRVTGIQPGHRVLDVGCGMGRYAIPLAARGINVEGLDLSPFLLAKLEAFNTSGVEIPTYCMDVLDCPAALENAYDAVVGFFALHHMHDLARCFTAMARLVKPGGVVAFLEPNAYNLLYYVQMRSRRGWPGRATRDRTHAPRRDLPGDACGRPDPVGAAPVRVLPAVRRQPPAGHPAGRTPGEHAPVATAAAGRAFTGQHRCPSACSKSSRRAELSTTETNPTVVREHPGIGVRIPANNGPAWPH